MSDGDEAPRGKLPPLTSTTMQQNSASVAAGLARLQSRKLNEAQGLSGPASRQGKRPSTPVEHITPEAQEIIDDSASARPSSGKSMTLRQLAAVMESGSDDGPRDISERADEYDAREVISRAVPEQGDARPSGAQLAASALAGMRKRS